MFFKRLIVRWTLWRLQQKKKESDVELETLIRLLLIDLAPGIYRRYSRPVGSRTRLDSIHGNVENLLTLIEDCTLQIIERGSLPIRALKGGEEVIETKLDRWLETVDRFPVSPETAWPLLVEHTQNLLDALERCEHQPLKVSYRRRLKYVLKDSLEAMEALLRVAL